MNSEQSTVEQQAPSVPILALNRRDAAKAIGVGRTTLWRLTSTGQIPVTTYGRIPVSALENWLKRETAVPEVRRTR